MTLSQKLQLADIITTLVKVSPAPQPQSILTEALVDSLQYVADDAGVPVGLKARLQALIDNVKTW